MAGRLILTMLVLSSLIDRESAVVTYPNLRLDFLNMTFEARRLCFQLLSSAFVQSHGLYASEILRR